MADFVSEEEFARVAAEFDARVFPAEPYWVEADRAVKDCQTVIGYSVWHIHPKSGRRKVRGFSKHRRGGWQVALHLANTLRDDLNGGIE